MLRSSLNLYVPLPNVLHLRFLSRVYGPIKENNTLNLYVPLPNVLHLRFLSPVYGPIKENNTLQQHQKGDTSSQQWIQEAF